MKKALLYGNGDFINLGCEAIARGAATILGQHGRYQLLMATYFPDADNKIINELKSKTIKLNRGREGIDNIIFEILFRLGLKRLALRIPHINARKIARNIHISIAVGGDNYCYDGRERYYRLNNGVRKTSHKNVFFGCSIEPSAIDSQMIADLNGYDVIYARESITYDALKKVCSTRVRKCSDPAFVMTPDYREIPAPLKAGNTKWIGVNLSPLIYAYARHPELVQDAVTQSLQNILDTTEQNILFFPHVYGENNDIFINRNFAEKLKCNPERIICYEKRINAAQMKGIISKLNAVICARTHASIAAYSSCVPTFVLGYSVKAKGLATDIYGEYTGHIMPVQDLENVTEFCEQVRNFIARIDDERKMLQKRMPDYIKDANIDLEDVF